MAIEKMLRKQLIQVLIDSNITILNRFFFEFVNEKQFFQMSVFEVILILYRSLTNKIKKVNIQDIDEVVLKPVLEFLRQNVKDENRRGRKRKENSQSETEIKTKIGHEQLAISEQNVSTTQVLHNFDISSNIVQMKKRGGKIGHTKTLQEAEEPVEKNNEPVIEPEIIEIDESDLANAIFDDSDLMGLAAPMTPMIDDQIQNVLNSPNMFNLQNTEMTQNSPTLTTLTTTDLSSLEHTQNINNQHFNSVSENQPDITSSSDYRPPPPAMIRLLEEATGKRPKTKFYGPKAFGNLSLPFHLDLGQYLNVDTGETDQRVEVLTNLSGKIGDTYDQECNDSDFKFYQNCEFTRKKRDEFPF